MRDPFFVSQVAQPEMKAANFVAKWLGYGAQSLGPVVLKDGGTEERVVETWVPKKKVKAYSLRWGEGRAPRFFSDKSVSLQADL